jgi:hypothetical protein
MAPHTLAPVRRIAMCGPASASGASGLAQMAVNWRVLAGLRSLPRLREKLTTTTR